MKTAFVLSYLGTRYSGWQRQENALAVQQVIEEAILKTCGQRVALSGCGRTDAGVHAKTYVASTQLESGIPLEQLPLALNARLPSDIVVCRAVAVPDSFDARFSCKSKEYTYYILNRKTRDPFYVDRAYFYPQQLDVAAMQQAAGAFEGRQDFRAVRNEGTPVKSTVRHMFYCRCGRQGEMITVTCCADGFLYNMVRNIVGTLLYVGRHKIEAALLPALLAAGKRVDTGPTAPACGLYLTKLEYGMEQLDG